MHLSYLLLKTALKSVGSSQRSKRTDSGSDFVLYYVKIPRLMRVYIVLEFGNITCAVSLVKRRFSHQSVWMRLYSWSGIPNVIQCIKLLMKYILRLWKHISCNNFMYLLYTSRRVN
uniref:Uncharacterized protein n=1 Tax=Pararge aegeria TaxID=116150 RepID=S4NWN0_9NEOP